MLQSIRDRSQGWLAWVVVGLISVPFALWGIQEYFTGGSTVIVATVNDEEITQRQFQETLQNQRQRMRSMLGAQFDPEMFDQPRMRQAILDSIIDNQLIMQTIKEQGYRVADTQLNSFIRGFEAFQQNGKFDRGLYSQRLQMQGMSPQAFELRLRSDLMKEQLRSGIANSEFITQQQIQTLASLMQQQRSFSWLELKLADHLKDSAISEQQISEFYQANKNNFAIAETLSVEYIDLSVDKLSKNIAIDDSVEKELQKLFNDNKDKLTTEEQRRASHILIEDKQLADSVHKKLLAGEDFAKLAKEFSIDTGSASNGGDLDFFGKGVMVPEFEQAVFSMQKNTISEPVKSEFGYHIIKLTGINSAKQQSYAEAKEGLIREYKYNKAEQLFFEQAELLANLTYEQPDSLEPTASELNLKLETSQSFSRNGGVGLFSNTKLVTAAFAEDVLIEGRNSEPVELSPDHIVVVRLHEHQPAGFKEQTAVKNLIVQAIREKNASESLHQSSMELVSKLKESPQKELQWQTHDKVTRNNQTLNPTVVAEAFKMVKPTGNNSSLTSVPLPSGNYAIIKLDEVITGSFENADKVIQPSQLQKSNGESIYSAYINYLRSHASIEKNL